MTDSPATQSGRKSNRRKAQMMPKKASFLEKPLESVSPTNQGGSTDPLKNLQLAAVLKRAKEMNVPKENIEKALAKVRWKESPSQTIDNPIKTRQAEARIRVVTLSYMRHWLSTLLVS
ncbi:hypothetical protein C0993_010526 [Termitomyces sp. T159_Od127]|nr:hypothetical protein C0993_010526 [Termitomyces sp. T159_Od127]